MNKKLKCFLVAKMYVLMPQIKHLLKKRKEKQKNNHLKWKKVINDLGNLNSTKLHFADDATDW